MSITTVLIEASIKFAAAVGGSCAEHVQNPHRPKKIRFL
jgi:hypothetical protein